MLSWDLVIGVSICSANSDSPKRFFCFIVMPPHVVVFWNACIENLVEKTSSDKSATMHVEYKQFRRYVSDLKPYPMRLL